MLKNVEPQCPENYTLSNTSCSCVPHVIHQAKKPSTKKPSIHNSNKRTRCPNGTRRNKKTGECISTKTLTAIATKTKKANKTKKTQAKKTQAKSKQSKTKKKELQNTQSNIISVKTSTPHDDLQISTAISKLLDKYSMKKYSSDFSKMLPDIRSELIEAKSFSPSINKRLVSLKDIPSENIFGCGLEDIISDKSDVKDKEFKYLNVRYGTSRTGEPLCVSYTSKKAQKILLNNLAATKNFTCENIVAPLQLDSNCWFNTMYMVFFVSDKGRKFFRFFRQLMIEGKHSNGKNIQPKKLAQALFLFNAYIESSYNLDNLPSYRKRASGFNTNLLIENIYKSIPQVHKKNKEMSGLKFSGEYGNPLNYYKSIISFLSPSSLAVYEPRLKTTSKADLLKLFNTKHSYSGEYYMPDVIVLVLYNEHLHNESLLQVDHVKKRPISFTRTYTGSNDTGKNPRDVKYTLDSAVVRSTNNQHFCALITCNKQEFAFDGGALVRVGKLQWKKLINTKRHWQFDDQEKNSHLNWSFSNCYQQLYYYRE